MTEKCHRGEVESEQPEPGAYTAAAGAHGRELSPDPEGRTMLADIRPADMRLAELRLAELRLVAVPDGAPPYDCPVHGADCPDRDGDHACRPRPGVRR